MIPTLAPAFIIPEGIGGGISGGGQNVALTAAGVVAATVIAGGLIVVAAPVVAAVAAKASLLTAASPLGLLAVGAFLKGLQQFQEWGWLNVKPGTSTGQAPPGTLVPLGPGDLLWSVTFQTQTTDKNRFSCGTGLPLPERANGWGNPSPVNGGGTHMRVASAGWTNDFVCGTTGLLPGNSLALVEIVRANGTVAGSFNVLTNRVLQTFNGERFTQKGDIRNVVATRNGVQVPYTVTTPNEFAPGVRPQLFPQTLPDAPTLPAPPLREPLQTPALPPPPDRRPLAPPVTIPRPGQQPARVPVPGPRPGPAPSPGPAPTPSQPAPAGVPAIGPLPLPIPLPVPTTPGSVVIVDGQPIGGPGQAPAPNLVAIAQELGRLERKNEILLSRPENGGLGEVAENAILGTLRSLLERLVTELLNDVPGGSFSLSHACPSPSGGDPLPPVVVPYEGGGNPTAGILAKMDGLAGLIQAHKSMGQPTCKTAVSGDEVTIHFESDF